MRLAMIAHKLSFAGDFRQTGVSRYVEYLLRYLPEALEPHEQLIALAGPDVRRENRVSEFDARISWNWSRWPTGRVPVRVLWEQLAAPLAIRRLQADVVHGPVNVVPMLTGARRVVTVHDLAFLAFPEQYPAGQRRYLTAMTRRSAQHSERVIAVSEYTRQDVIRRFDIAPENVVTVPNGVDDSYYPRAGSDALERFREEQQLPEQFLLFVGTLQPRKNLLGLLRAFASMRPEERVPLYVVGAPGWMYAEVFSEVQRLGIEAEVSFPGFATSETLPLWYSAAAAFVYPSFYEGFGLPVLEAMACGTAVLTSNVSSLPEVAGDAALVVDPADADAIAAGLRTLLSDDSLRETLSRAGLSRSRNYSWKQTAVQTAAVYRTVVAN